MAKDKIPGSSQELYAVSVESMPQYKDQCCNPGRVGKDLLCGVLIALAVICGAVAIFLIVFFAVSDTPADELVPSPAENSTGFGSSPLTRNEEESKVNSIDDWSKDPFGLPEVGIHEPEINVAGLFPLFKTIPKDVVEQPQADPEARAQAETEPQAEPEPGAESDPRSPESERVETAAEEMEEPILIETIEAVEDNSGAAAAAADDDDAKELVEIAIINATDGGSVEPAIVIADEPEVIALFDDDVSNHTSASPEEPEHPPVSSRPVDAAWIPISVEVATTNSSGGGGGGESPAGNNSSAGIEMESEQASAESVIDSGNDTLTTLNESAGPASFEMELALTEDEEQLSTESSLPADHVAHLPIVNNTLNNSGEQNIGHPFIGDNGNSSAGQCVKRQLPFCKGILPYPETMLPNWAKDSNEHERDLSVPYFEIIAESECNPRVQQYACAVLEPPCNQGVMLPPCQQFCRAIAEDCKNYVLSALTLASTLDCDQFPDSNDPTVCMNLASTSDEGECLVGEFRCSDNTCIPERWLCDGRKDCSLGDDEFSCSLCTAQEFKCEAENRCIPARWRCDGSKDCADGSDEVDCQVSEPVSPPTLVVSSSPISLPECLPDEFQCQDGLSCIPSRRVCDGANHCRDNSDEVNCTLWVCHDDDFKCHDSGVCIARSSVCDSAIDCKDGSDEQECSSGSESAGDEESNGSASGNPETESNPEKCPLGELLCISDGACIRFEQLCDGTKDCSDGADETDCSGDSDE